MEGIGIQAVGGNREGYRYEASLHRAWEGMHFDRQRLTTTELQPLRILNPGILNHHQGPDFLNATIQIGKARFHGDVELHIAAEDWKRHGHDRDPHYDSVVLHAYLISGRQPALRADGTRIPELYLGDRIGPALLPKVQTTLPCSGIGRHHLPSAPSEWLEAAGMRRMLGKAKVLKERLVATHYDWQQVLWEEIANALGGPVNGVHFRQLVQQAPWALVRKYVHSQACIEALLFGACGILDGQAIEAYKAMLKENWEFLRQKHGLKSRPLPFKFHRMHPAGFPALRIGQLGMIATSYRPLCQLLEAGVIRQFWRERISGSEYWARHYDFGDVLHSRQNDLGSDARERIVANVLVPLALVAMECGDGRSGMGDGGRLNGMGDGGPGRAVAAGSSLGGLLDLLREMPAEHNKVTRKLAPLGLIPRNALQSQGMIALYKDQCSTFDCLECAIGKSVFS